MYHGILFNYIVWYFMVYCDAWWHTAMFQVLWAHLYVWTRLTVLMISTWTMVIRGIGVSEAYQNVLTESPSLSGSNSVSTLIMLSITMYHQGVKQGNPMGLQFEPNTAFWMLYLEHLKIYGRSRWLISSKVCVYFLPGIIGPPNSFTSP